MRGIYAACLVALFVAVGVVVAGCASGAVTDSGKVLRSVSLEISGMPALDSDAPEVSATATGVTYGTPSARYLGGTGPQWDPSSALLTGIAHQVYTDRNAGLSVFVGNDAYVPYTISSAQGVAHHVFIRNETGATMDEPWLELREIYGNWTWDPDLTTQATAPAPNTGLRTMASWGDGFTIGNNSGGPGGYTAGPNAAYTGGYDLDTYETLETYERAMHFRWTGTSGDWNTDLGMFVARLSLWWYETL